MAEYKAGLEGVVAGESAISTVGQVGSGLTYRGYDIHDLVSGKSFEEVAYLLLYGKLPTLSEWRAYVKRLQSKRTLPASLKSILEYIPDYAHPMDVLRTGCSYLGTIEPERTFSEEKDIADRLLAIFPGMLCYWYHFHQSHQRIDEHSDEETLGGHFLSLLYRQSPIPLAKEMLNISLILYAEHDYNASTFAARVTAGTLSDFYSCITSAIGALRGPLHGGANEAAMALLARFKSVDEAEIGLKDMLKRKEKIMGFGHRIYKTCDPRSDVMKALSRQLSIAKNDPLLFVISECVETLMHQEKNLFPNLDFYSASAYHYANIPTVLFTPIFVMSRITGWAAHIFEQRAHNRLIRPSSIYIGPTRQTYIAIEHRG